MKEITISPPRGQNLRLGILSDTHDNVTGIRQALRVFKKKKVHHILHLGDLCAPETAWEFAGEKVSILLGNNELEIVKLCRTLEQIGLGYLGEEARFESGGKTIGLYHGTRQSTLDRLAESQKFDYLLKGHSHEIEDYKVGRTRVLNPGAVYRVQPKTVGIFEPARDTFSILELPRNGI
jgi:uncharacterized protein